MRPHASETNPPEWLVRSATKALARRAVLRAGIGLSLAAVPLLLPASAAAANAQIGWRFCTKCRGLFLPGKTKRGPDLGVCPAGGKHRPRTDLNYIVRFAGPVVNPELFKNFQRCRKCRGLFANDLGETGVCPAGGAHAAGDTFYELWEGATIPGMDDAWDECAKCSGVFNWAGGNQGRCPAGGGHERSDPSSRYTLFVLSV